MRCFLPFAVELLQCHVFVMEQVAPIRVVQMTVNVMQVPPIIKVLSPYQTILLETK